MYSIKENFQLAGFNTFHVAAIARYFIELNDESSVRDFLKSEMRDQYPVLVLGGGSNVLFTKDFPGVVIHPLIRGIAVESEKGSIVCLKVGAGENWDGFVQYCVERNLGGIENLSWIPGLVGASPVQNIGAYGMEIKDNVEKVEGFFIDSGKKFSLSANECRFAYRDSIFKNDLKGKVIITRVVFKLNREPVFNTSYPDLLKEMDEYSDTTIHNIRQAIIKIRKFKLPDPAETGNAGSFFKNPVVSEERCSELRRFFPSIPIYIMHDGSYKISAAWLIDQAGWKGKSCGKAGTHKRQPLIIINHGDATGEEIYQCSLKIRKAVMNQFGIRLETEVNII
ncbi:MAG TPA: UDP-N-acetylmuramate dehydrogenase [Bacteroidales bacterium]|nr:UDP-N-acetylmuramate dehydrogenase [Bacteroidales bacterium]